jgi:hypothetical protein
MCDDLGDTKKIYTKDNTDNFHYGSYLKGARALA